MSVRYNGSSTGSYDSAAASYFWKDGTEKTIGSAKSGFGIYGLNAFAEVSALCDSTERTLSVAVGGYSADIRITVIIGGKVIKTEDIVGSNEKKLDRIVSVKYSSDIPTTATVRWEVTADKGNWESINIEGIALSRSTSSPLLDTPIIDYSKGKISVRTVAYASDGGEVIIALKDNSGLLKDTIIKKAEAGKWSIESSNINVGVGFAGAVEAYLWKDGVPLAKSQSVIINSSLISDYSIGPMTAKRLIKEGAVLVDVRSEEEYRQEHLDGAINIDYSKIGELAQSLLPDKNAKIILYCRSAKRSAQATSTLLKLGYTAVFNLGSMSNFQTQAEISFSHDNCTVVKKGDALNVSFTANVYDDPKVYLSCGKSSTFSDAVPIEEFTVPECEGYYITIKAYLVQDGVSHAECEKQFIFWSENAPGVFASDLDWTYSDCGWGSIKRDKSIEGRALTIAGKTFSKGIGTHATSTITMNIPEGCNKFLAIGGCDNEIKGDGRMILYVFIDGVLADCSSFICTGEYYVFDIDIPSSAREIKLYAYEGAYGGNTNDHSDWAIAEFFKID